MTQLARNVATTYVARFAIVCSGLFLFPFVTHHVGLSQYGLWLLVNGVTVVRDGRHTGALPGRVLRRRPGGVA